MEETKYSINRSIVGVIILDNHPDKKNYEVERNENNSLIRKTEKLNINETFPTEKRCYK